MHDLIKFSLLLFLFHQKYKEKCVLGPEAPDDIPHDTSSSIVAPNMCDSPFK